MMKQSLILLIMSLLLLVACGDSGDAQSPRESLPGAAAFPATDAQLALGGKIYADNCARCHGVNAEGDAAWRKRDAQGFFPPPPLNGSGHAWHHPMSVLKSVIQTGSVDGSGRMPAWQGHLSDAEIDAVIAWFQSHWPPPIYQAWSDIERRGQ